MTIAIASTAREAMIAHAVRDHPREACGIVFGGPATIDTALATANVAANPECGFEIEPAALLRAQRDARGAKWGDARGAGRAVVGWYHSHPNGVAEPSATDAARAVEDGRLWLIIAAGAVSAWRVVAGGTLHGRFDAVDLVAA